MLDKIDPRVIEVGIELDGKINTYSGLGISATGTKYANSLQNDAEIKIANLTRSHRDFILTETSPFNVNRTPKKVTLSAGRVSYGLSKIFEGDIISSNISQPPDIWLSLKCLTGNFYKSTVVSKGGNSQLPLSQLSAQVAKDLNVRLDFQAIDKPISNYNFTGSSLNQIQKLSDAGAVDAYLDDGTLIVKELNLALSNNSQVISESTGMVGIPELTEQGVKVKFLLNGQTTLGGSMQVQSTLNPAANGTYIIYKLSFDVANRNDPFYWVAEGKRQL